jgi:hypothetical protein
MLPPKYSLHCGYGQSRQSIWVMDAVNANALPQLQWYFPPYFNCTGWRETTMPSIFEWEVVVVVGVMGILEGGGA